MDKLVDGKPGASRRTVLATGLAAAGTTVIGPSPAVHARDPSTAAPGAESSSVSTLTFTEIPHGLDATHLVAPGHSVQVLLRWGDPLFKTSPAWSPGAQTASAQG